ncbi:hypothetical protein ACH5RR_007547 [Cinchona calisaya]|uniref:Thioredoxin domain-containing protein n=1 Tax=Cinchona calisaya TaxID=153742 RepID=A0ABD3AS87_9GENT
MMVERSTRRMRLLMMMMMFCICLVSSIRSSVASSSEPMCRRPASESEPSRILESLLQIPSNPPTCPLSFLPPSVLHVNGNFLEGALASKRRNDHTAVLFYASWCPFSRSAHITFEVLSSMYPHIEHLAVEQSSAMPSLFSKYGIHSLPAILMVNQKSRVRFHGSKDPDSLIKFYEHTTGSVPVQYVAVNQSGSFVPCERTILQSWIGSSKDEILSREPYLIFSVLFLLLRVLVYIMPRVQYRIKTIWASYRPHLNLEIFWEASQVLGHILHMIDVKRVWTKLRLCKNRNFHWGARNAKVWASSLASVSTSRLSS